MDEFAREFLKVPKGTGARQPFRLRPWQRDIVRKLYPGRGKRPRQGLVSLPRGNGKTALAAVLALYNLFADEVESAQILIVASDERQAGHVMKAAARMIELDERLADRVQVYQDRIVVPGTDSELRALPASVDALQGWDPSLMIVDELHVVNEDVWEAVMSAAGKRPESLTLAISTPADSQDSVMWRLVADARANPTDGSFVLVEYGAPTGCELDDRNAWKLANPALGDFLHLDAMEALQPPRMRETSFRRYRLGQWVGHDETWLPWGAWEACQQDTDIDPKQRVVLFFDGSASGDSTALMGCTVDEPRHVFTVGLWEDTGDPRWRVPRDEVDAAVDAAFTRHNVVELGCDPWGWRSEIEQWSKRYGQRRVIEWPTNMIKRMAPATDLAYQAIVKGEITHDGHPEVANHLAHCVGKSTALGDVITKDRKNSPRKIDAAVCIVGAHARAVHHASKRRGRVAVHK